jgi:hypothetical protein
VGTSVVVGFNPNYNFKNMNDTLVIRKDNQDRSEHGDMVEYHIMKGVGIIRKINHTKKEDWQLLRYHIKMNN